MIVNDGKNPKLNQTVEARAIVIEKFEGNRTARVEEIYFKLQDYAQSIQLEKVRLCGRQPNLAKRNFKRYFNRRARLQKYQA